MEKPIKYLVAIIGLGALLAGNVNAKTLTIEDAQTLFSYSSSLERQAKSTEVRAAVDSTEKEEVTAVVLVRFRQIVAMSQDDRVRESKDSGSIDAPNQRQLKARLSRKENRLRQKLGTPKGTVLKGEFVTNTIRSLSVTKQQFLNLVADIEFDLFSNELHRPLLVSSIPIVFPQQANSEYLGSGASVAVLDTGVSSSHSFYSNRIIQSAAACFSNNNNVADMQLPSGNSSLCPAGAGMATGSGTGDACDSTILGCEHGTQMAGIIAGAGMDNGVATAASIVPVQVFTRLDNEDVCGVETCIVATTLDILRGLQHVHGLINGEDIAAVSLNFGTTALFQGNCDGQNGSVYTDIVQDITDLGVAVIAPSGNTGNNNEMPSPACIDAVISVAATDDFDTPWIGNNRNSELDFFAPGVDIISSSLPAKQFSSVTGTSAAAAHVAGAWAVLKSKNPFNSVANIKTALTSTGSLLTQGAAVDKPRIDIGAALGAIELPDDVDSEICFPIKLSSSAISVICL